MYKYIKKETIFLGVRLTKDKEAVITVWEWNEYIKSGNLYSHNL